ncbi:MAG: hypothetical protein QOC93_3831 [Actinomycetota bacterium]|jgi:hypothetical protein|nr:hypothetical protein [Actinomycetota bacterium]
MDNTPAEQSPPKAFISYSWDDEEHKAWVLQLATRLINNGVHVVLDRWDVHLGSDLLSFMESGLRDTDRVIVVSSDEYIRKSNVPAGGVGYEKRIISAQIAADLDVSRVIPLIRNNTSCPRVPTFLSALAYVDFSNDAYFEEKYAELIYELHGERILPRPSLGSNPFLRHAGADVERALSIDPTRYASQSPEGSVSFDYLNNNGHFNIGMGDRRFTLAFGQSGDGSIYVYNDPSDIDWISLAPQTSMDQIHDLWAYDSSSRHRTALVGDTVVLRNTSGNFAAVTIDLVRRRDNLTGTALVEFHYRVALHGNTDMTDEST